MTIPFPMLNFCHRADLSADLWDACLAASSQRILYAFSWYLDTVCENWGAVVEQEGGRYVSVFPVPYKQRLGIRQVYQPFFTQQLGLFTTARSRHCTITEYLACLPSHFRKVFLQLNTANTTALLETGVESGFDLRLRTTYHLSLDRPYAQLAESYSTNLRRNLQKARSHGFHISPSANLSPLVRLFRYTKGPEVPELTDQDYARLERLFAETRDHRAGHLLEIWREGALAAGAFFLQEPGKVIFLFGATSAEGKKAGAMPLLLDYLIQRRAGSGDILDFEGSDLPGVARFYASFGAQPVSYVSLSQTTLPWYLRWR